MLTYIQPEVINKRSMKVAVLGGTGFLGSKICAAIARRNWMPVAIGSKTTYELHDFDAVVHSVGTIMPDPRYKKIISQPMSLTSLAQLAKMRFGLDPPNPLSKDQNSFEYLNVDTARNAALRLSARTTNNPESSRIPFVYISADAWTQFADPQYIATKRRAESYLESLPYLRCVFVRPGFISPDPPTSCLQATPRHLIDKILAATNEESRISGQVVAEAVCDAIEDSSIEGVISSEALKTFEKLDY